MLIAPYPQEEAQRLAALHAYHAFGTGPEPGFDRITALAARTLGVPSAYISLVGDDTQWLKSCFNLPGPRETGRDIAFCAHAILCDDVFVVTDAKSDPRFWDNPLVTGEPYIRFYAGCPLRTPSGHSIGTLCAVDSSPRIPTAEMLSNLRDLAKLVVDQFELRHWLADEEDRQKSKAETNYRRLADAIHGMVFRFRQSSETEYEYEYVSPGSVALMGLPPEALHENPKAFIRSIVAEDVADFWCAMEQTWRDGQPWSWSGRILASCGMTKWVKGEGRTERLGDGTLIIEGLICDVTESKIREAALGEAKEGAERANLAKSEFLSRMSHELRTPMNAILGFAQMLDLEPLGTAAQEDLAQVRKAGEHLLGLINEVLDLSSLDASRMSMSIEPVLLSDVVNETTGLLRPLFEARGIRYQAMPTNVDRHVLADRQRLKQVLINLLTNAVKYNSERGRVTLRIFDEGGMIAIEIGDQGAGIPADKMDRLFTPFERLGAEASEVEGTGLGLAISRGLAERMGGQLTAVSAEGEGSTFTVRLPLSARPTVELPEPPPASEPCAPSVGVREVLYVEDNESNVLLIRRILRQRPDISLTIVNTLAEGLLRLAGPIPALLLLDLNLPDGSGESIVNWVRSECANPELPMIVLSADATPRQIQRLKDAGANDYLTKPLDLQEFLDAIDRALEVSA